MDRFTDEELVHIVAWQKINGPIGPQRLDVLFARLGMDVVAPHMKKGKKPKFEDHAIEWSRKSKSPQDMLAAAKSITAAFKQVEKAKDKKQQAKAKREGRSQTGKEVTPDGNSGGTLDRRRRRRR